MRILIVSNPELSLEGGAAQVAIQLTEALRRRGHNVTPWSPGPTAGPPRPWDPHLARLARVQRYIDGAGALDVIDAPCSSGNLRVPPGAQLVVRSNQPQLRYLAFDLRQQLARRPWIAALGALNLARSVQLVLGSWHRAHRILCLGSLELAWMRQRFGRWAGKLGSYRHAPPNGERAALLRVRAGRERSSAQRFTGPRASRYLWIGRWTHHKGTRRLLRFLSERAAAEAGATFTLAGTGQAAEEILPRPLQARVRVIPAFTRGELPRILADHDVGLFTSEIEGWGLSLQEMLESGLPVFATEAGAVPDLRPFFSHRLRAFPPPSVPELFDLPLDDLASSSYLDELNWDAIATDYERQVGAAA